MFTDRLTGLDHEELSSLAGSPCMLGQGSKQVGFTGPAATPPSCTCTRLKFKRIKELHIKPKTLEHIEEKVGKNLEDMGTEEKIMNRTLMTCDVKSRSRNGTS